MSTKHERKLVQKLSDAYDHWIEHDDDFAVLVDALTKVREAFHVVGYGFIEPEEYQTRAVVDIHMERGGAFEVVEGGISASGRYLVVPYEETTNESTPHG